MTLASRLRAIADRLDAAHAIRRAAVDELVDLAVAKTELLDEFEPIEQPANPPSPVEAAEVVRSPDSAASIEQGVPSVSKEPGTATVAVLHDKNWHPLCPDCGASAGSKQGMARHRELKHAGAVRVERTPADQAGERGIDTRPPLHAPDGFTCAEHGVSFPTRQALGMHRNWHLRRLAALPGVPIEPAPLLRSHETSDERPSDPRWPRRSTIAERVAARDAGRAGKRYPNGRGGSLGE